MNDKTIRVLIAPCGCMCAADASLSFPGFCRTNEEAAEDLQNGFVEKRMPLDEYRAMNLNCTHEPEWGVA